MSTRFRNAWLGLGLLLATACSARDVAQPGVVVERRGDALARVQRGAAACPSSGP